MTVKFANTCTQREHWRKNTVRNGTGDREHDEEELKDAVNNKVEGLERVAPGRASLESLHVIVREELVVNGLLIEVHVVDWESNN